MKCKNKAFFRIQSVTVDGREVDASTFPKLATESIELDCNSQVIEEVKIKPSKKVISILYIIHLLHLIHFYVSIIELAHLWSVAY